MGELLENFKRAISDEEPTEHGYVCPYCCSDGLDPGARFQDGSETRLKFNCDVCHRPFDIITWDFST